MFFSELPLVIYRQSVQMIWLPAHNMNLKHNLQLGETHKKKTNTESEIIPSFTASSTETLISLLIYMQSHFVIWQWLSGDSSVEVFMKELSFPESNDNWIITMFYHQSTVTIFSVHKILLIVCRKLYSSLGHDFIADIFTHFKFRDSNKLENDKIMFPEICMAPGLIWYQNALVHNHFILQCRRPKDLYFTSLSVGLPVLSVYHYHRLS